MTAALACVGAVYALYLALTGAGAARLELRRTKRRSSAPGSLPSATVVVPARNEGRNIVRCIQSLKAQTVAVEIVVVDDGSEDDTRAAAEKCGVRVISAQGTGKKAALTAGIAVASGDVVLATDADSFAGPTWAEALLRRFDDKTTFVAGPVRMETGGTVFGAFQALESAGLMGLAGGGFAVGFPHLANGANLAFRRSAFEAVGGYGSDPAASGDDMFLVEKLRKIGKGRYAWDADAVVFTPACATWTEFWNQRLRWAGKNRRYQSPVMATVQTSALAYVILLLASALAGETHTALWAWAAKSALEVLPLIPAARLLGRTKLLPLYPVIQLYYPLYVAVFGTAALIAPKYRWKGRLAR